MTTDDVQRALDAINIISDDDAQAHLLEDQLFADVLTAIADGTCVDPPACARLALTSLAIGFARWYE